MTETSTALTVVPHGGLSIMVTPDEARENLIKLQTFIKEYFTAEDYGLIPGTGDKPALKKPGAEKLLELYGFYPEYEMTQRIEDWDKLLFDYEFKVTVKRRSDDKIMGVGVGSCNSYESRYRWRKAARSCPLCGTQAIKVSQYEPVGSFYCYGKAGGCNAKFSKDDPAITGQALSRVLNEDLADQKNTVLKQAKKRCLVDGALGSTRSSGLFTQDIDEMASFDYATGEIVEAEVIEAGKPGPKLSSSSSQTSSTQSRSSQAQGSGAKNATTTTASTQSTHGSAGSGQQPTSTSGNTEKKSGATTAQQSTTQKPTGASGANTQTSNQQQTNTGAPPAGGEAKKSDAAGATPSQSPAATGAQHATETTSNSTELINDEQRKGLLDTARKIHGWTPPQVAQYLKSIGGTLTKLTKAQLDIALAYTSANAP